MKWKKGRIKKKIEKRTKNEKEMVEKRWKKNKNGNRNKETVDAVKGKG